MPAVLAASVAGGVPTPAAPPADRKLRVTFLALERGEATIIRPPGGAAMLIGGGAPGEGSEVVRALRSAGVRSLDAVVLQTWKAGHVGGLRAVMEAFKPGRVTFNPEYARAPACDAFYAHAQSLADARRLVFQSFSPGEEVSLSRQPVCLLTVHSPIGPMLERYRGQAKCSAIYEVGMQKASCLSLGDSTARMQREYWVQRDPKPWGHVLAIGRGGAVDALAAEQLKALRTRAAVLPIPRRSGLQPAPSVLAALRRAGVAVHRTDREGTLTATLTEAGAVTVTRGMR